MEENLDLNNKEVVVNDKPEWFALIKKSREDYEKIYETSLKRKHGIVLNWSFVFANIFWLAYRKMYGHALILTLLQLLLFIDFLCLKDVPNYGDGSVINALMLMASVIINIAYYLFANKLYFKHLENKYKEGATPETYKDTNKIFETIGWLYFILRVIQSGFQTIPYVKEYAVVIENSEQLMLLFLPILFYYIKEKIEFKKKASS